MAVQASYPGVYTNIIPSGVRTISGVSTSIAMFIGRAAQGELNKPVLCLSYEDFVRTFSEKFANSDLVRSVKLFYANGGKQCYVMRIADMTTAQAANVVLQNEAGSGALRLEAISEGVLGDRIRAVVDYDTSQPENGFNLSVFRWEDDGAGVLQQNKLERHISLSMDPNNSRYAPDVIARDSSLVKATDVTVDAPTPGFSQSGFAVSGRTNTIWRDQWQSLIGSAVTTNRFMLSVDGNAPREVDLSSIDFSDAGHPLPVNTVATAIANLAQRIEDIINNNVLAGTGSSVSVEIPSQGGGPFSYPTNPIGPEGPAGEDNTFTSYLRISSNAPGDVNIFPATTNDLTIPLMLGTSQGGVEVGSFSKLRPAPSGNTTSIDDLVTFAEMEQAAIDSIVVDGVVISIAGGAHDVNTSDAIINSPRMYQDASATDQNDGRGGIVEKLSIIAAAINDHALADPSFRYQASVWGYRLSINPTEGGDNTVLNVGTEIGGGVGPVISTNAVSNTRYYSLGTSGLPQFQTPGLAGNDGTKPRPADYENAYRIIDSNIDLFNFLILPKDHEHTDTETRQLWGSASQLAQKRRALLLIDPPDGWDGPQAAVNTSTGVNSLRVGLVKDRSAIFYPKVKIIDKGAEVNIGASGAIAGIAARIDATRGFWKAPAGLEADLRGVVGVEHQFSDDQNGVTYPNAINNIRLISGSVVNWGARTMDGADALASEWRHMSIVRTALYIEESLYRGLKWAVFQPNDEPLYAEIRLSVGSFMHNLFRQGAFQGDTPKLSYSVQCDETTTTESDRNLGIVNIHVGFAPLKPAEFIFLHLKQMAGQIQV